MLLKYGFGYALAYHRSENTKSGRILENLQRIYTDTVERFSRENKSPLGEVCYCIYKVVSPKEIVKTLGNMIRNFTSAAMKLDGIFLNTMVIFINIMAITPWNKSVLTI